MDEVKLLRAKVARLERAIGLLQGEIQGLLDVQRAQIAVAGVANGTIDELTATGGALAPAFQALRIVTNATTMGATALGQRRRPHIRAPMQAGRQAVWAYVSRAKLPAETD